MSTKTWTRAADGIWRNKNGTLYERPKIAGNFTFRSLKTSNLKLAREEYCKRRSGDYSYAEKTDLLETVGDVIRLYQKDGYPDRQRQKRPETMNGIEERNCLSLMGFWENIPVDDVTWGACDRYHTWRTKKINHGKTGNRTVDNDLATLSNAFVWACRCELVKANPLATRPHYRTDSEIKHCREAMPNDATHLHQIAGELFSRKACSQVLGWQMLVEACTGLRTCEALQLRWDAKPYEPGWITPDGKSLCVRRAKGQHMVGAGSIMGIQQGNFWRVFADF